MNLHDYREEKPRRIRRVVWAVVNATLFRWAGGRLLWPVRRMLLRAFGARVDRHAYVYARCKIFAPWLLTLGRTCVGPDTELYNKAPISIGDDSVVSQGTMLCTASHDISSPMLPLTTAPISVGKNVWIAARCYVGPGVTLGDGVVVGATASVYRSVPPMTVVGGNPARQISTRKFSDL